MSELNFIKKLYGLDLIRMLAVIFVFFFHAHIHIGCTFWKLTDFISQGAIFMDLFFLLSGFISCYNYFDKMKNSREVLIFFKKRLLSIYPLYVVVMIVYTILYNEISIFKHILIAPIEIFLLQSHFSSLFNVLHNDGTWFISSIAFSYFLFPLLLLILKYINNIHRYYLILFLTYLICSLSPIITIAFSTDSIYFSPFFRMLEFFMGMVLSILFIKRNKPSNKNNWLPISITTILLLLLIFIITLFVKFNFLNYLYYSFISLPVFCIIIYNLSLVNSPPLYTHAYGISILSLLNLVNKCFYAFFLSQIFAFDMFKYFDNTYNWKLSNIGRIFTSFIICVIITVIFKLLEIPVKN